MKKLLLAGAIALTGLVSAQEYKPEAGDVTAEFMVKGGIDNTSFDFANGGTMGAAIRGRYFKSENVAYRAAVYVGNESNSVNDSKTSKTGFDLAFGVEKHYNGTERLSPYIGAELYLGLASESTKENGNKASKPSQFGVGVRGVFGADYYFVKNVYLGAEAGLGIGYKTVGEGDPKVQDSSNSFSVAPFVAGVRLGFVF